MELLHLKYFQTVARYEHITQAAKALNLSQPSLSIMISKLEEELGTPLFDRTGRNIKLNQAGGIFLKYVQRVFLDLENAKRELKEFSGQKNNSLSLVTTSSRLLSGVIAECILMYPDIKLRQVVASYEATKNYIKSGEIDYCISSPLIKEEGIKTIELLDEEIFLCVPFRHRYAKRESINLKEVADDNFLCLSDGYGFRTITNNICKMAGFSPNVVFEGDYIHILQLINIGKGIAFVPKSATRAFDNMPVSIIKIDEPICRRKIGLSWVEDRYFAKVAINFKPFIIDYYKEKFSCF